ncbi:hypothetical protein F4703DRAFT_1970018 [Phycomyces blakesleeanus]
MDTINHISPSFESYITVFAKIVPKGFYVVAAVALFLCKVYDFTAAPYKLRHFPKVSFFAFSKSIFSAESVEHRTKRLISPLLHKYKGFYIAKFPLYWTVFVTEPHAVQYVLMKGEIFPKKTRFMNTPNKDSLMIRLFGSSNIAFASGEIWKHQRKIMNPAFHRTAPIELFGRMIPDMFRLIDKSNGNIMLADLLHRITFDAMGKALFGFDFKTAREENSEWTSAYNDAMSGISAPILNITPSLEHITRYLYPDYAKAKKGIDKLTELTLEMVNERKEKIQEAIGQPDDGREKDFLTLIIEAEMKEDKASGSGGLRENLKAFLVAGHASTASSISFCIYHLAMNKDVQNKARKEALDILGDDANISTPTVNECKHITYINMIIKETLRLNAPFGTLFERIATEDVTLSGVFIPKGTIISVDIETIHKNPAIWKSPTVFDPERFSKGGEHDQHEGITWAPFSDGNRKCLGINFSMAEQQVILLMLLKHYEWDLSENSIHKNGIVYDGISLFTPRSLYIKFNKRH